MYYVLNALLGAAVAVVIAYISRSQLYVLAGLAMFFPTFGLFAYILAFREGGQSQVKEVVLFSFISIIPYLLYLVAMYVLLGKMRFSYTMLLSLGVWSIGASIIYLYARRYLGV